MSPARPAITWGRFLSWCRDNQIRDESLICDDDSRWLVSAGKDYESITLEFWSNFKGRAVITVGQLKEIGAGLGIQDTDKLLFKEDFLGDRVVDLGEHYDDDGVQDILQLQKRWG